MPPPSVPHNTPHSTPQHRAVSASNGVGGGGNLNLAVAAASAAVDNSRLTVVLNPTEDEEEPGGATNFAYQQVSARGGGEI